MKSFVKGIILVITGVFIVTCAATIAFPQGAITLVSIVLGSGGGVVTPSNPLPVSGVLPTGAATSANQSTEISSLGTLHTDLTTLNTTAGNPLASQSPAVPIGGMGICDGANGTTNPCTNAATVKAASTAPAVTDKALVVALSPNGLDPCQANAKSFLPITATTSLVKVIATGVAAKKIYVCQLLLTVTAADNVAVFEATTGTTCATSPVAVYGAGTSVATAANGFPFPANGGVSLGNGSATIGQTTVANNDLCIGTSAATPLTGGITYVTQ